MNSKAAGLWVNSVRAAVGSITALKETIMRRAGFGLVVVTVVCSAVFEAHGEIEPGYVSLFNGENLAGWDGDPRLWSVKDGAIHGETTEQNQIDSNTFLVWRGGKLEDFILKIKFRIRNGNSGIQYRSKEFDKWKISGYQAEVTNGPGAVGFLYHERGRGALVRVGQSVVIDEKGEKKVVSSVADAERLKEEGYCNVGDWNEYTIVARGNHILQYLNGYPTVELIDNDRVTDPKNPADRNGAAFEGLLALQIHKGPPMVVEFKDIRVKHLEGDYGRAVRLFNGENLEGWAYSSDNVEQAFVVEDGVLACKGRPIGYVRTKKDYANYVVRMQMKHLAGGNSGVLLRVTGPDKVWPKSLEAQGMSGNMGDIFTIDGFKLTTDPARSGGRRTRKIHESNEKPMGRWNDFEIYINGGDLGIYVNRLLQNVAQDCEVVAGKIGLQSEGSPKAFRNIVLIPIGN